MTLRDTKEFLSSYRWIIQEERSIQDERNKWMEQAEKVTSTTTAMPKSNAVGDKVGKSAVELARLDEMWNELICEKVRIITAIEQAIERVDNPQYRTVLRMRYLQCMTIEAIAEQLHYSWSQIQRICYSSIRAIHNARK